MISIVNEKIVKVSVNDTGIVNTDIRIKQGDTDICFVIIATLPDRMVVTSNICNKAEISIKRSDGTTYIGECEITDITNRGILYYVKDTEFSVKGRTYIDVKLTDAETNKILSTQTFVVDVVENTNTGDYSENTVNFNEIIGAIDSVPEKIEEINETAQKWIDEFPDEAEMTKIIQNKADKDVVDELAADVDSLNSNLTNQRDGEYPLGKNLIDFPTLETSTTSVNRNTMVRVDIPSGTYNFSFLTNAVANSGNFNLIFEDETSEITRHYFQTLTAGQRNNYIVTLTRNAKSVRIYCEQGSFTISEIMLNVGSAPLDYETPIKSNKVLSDEVNSVNDSLNYLYDGTKNYLLDKIATVTKYGVTYTKSGDSLIVNGTSTSNAGMNLLDHWICTRDCKTKLTGCPSGGSSKTYNMFIYDETNNKLVGIDTGDGFETNLSKGVSYSIGISVFNGYTISNKTFTPSLTFTKVDEIGLDVDNVNADLIEVDTNAKCYVANLTYNSYVFAINTGVKDKTNVFGYAVGTDLNGNQLVVYSSEYNASTGQFVARPVGTAFKKDTVVHVVVFFNAIQKNV